MRRPDGQPHNPAAGKRLLDGRSRVVKQNHGIPKVHDSHVPGACDRNKAMGFQCILVFVQTEAQRVGEAVFLEPFQGFVYGGQSLVVRFGHFALDPGDHGDPAGNKASQNRGCLHVMAFLVKVSLIDLMIPHISTDLTLRIFPDNGNDVRMDFCLHRQADRCFLVSRLHGVQPVGADVVFGKRADQCRDLSALIDIVPDHGGTDALQMRRQMYEIRFVQKLSGDLFLVDFGTVPGKNNMMQALHRICFRCLPVGRSIFYHITAGHKGRPAAVHRIDQAPDVLRKRNVDGNFFRKQINVLHMGRGHFDDLPAHLEGLGPLGPRKLVGRKIDPVSHPADLLYDFCMPQRKRIKGAGEEGAGERLFAQRLSMIRLLVIGYKSINVMKRGSHEVPGQASAFKSGKRKDLSGHEGIIFRLAA